MSFQSDLDKFRELCQYRTNKIFAGTVLEAFNSIQTGSPITASPGQPVDTGALRASWQVQFLSETEALISTNSPYAHSIEDGISYSHKGEPLTIHSPVGGAHSVAITIFG